MPSSTRSNKDKHLLFSEDHAHLERTIRKDQRFTSLDAAVFTSTDSHTQPSADTRPSSSTDLHRLTSIDTTPRTSIDHQSQNMVAIVILRQDENGNLYDQDGHLLNATEVWKPGWKQKLLWQWCMPSSTRSNLDKHLLFSENPTHLERTIRKYQRSTSLDAAAFTSTDSHTQPSTDTRPSSSTDLHRSTSIDTTLRTSIDHQSRNIVAIVILRHDENGNMYDQDGHLRNATGQKLDAQGNCINEKHPVDHFTLPDQFYPDFAFQQPNKKGRDDNSIGSWADSGFHESFEVETVIPSSNEDPTEEYDEDYWKERAIEIAMQDERYSRHSFNNTSPPSIDRVYSASVDTHPYPEKQSYASIDTTPGTSIDIKVAAFEKEKGNIPIPSRDPDGHTRAMDGIILQVSREDIADILQLANGPDNLAPSPSIDRRYECGRRAYEIYGARKFRWEQKDEYGVYRDESGYGRSVAGEMIPVTKDNIRKILERASLFEGSHICLPEHATSFTPAKVAPEIYTKDEINEMVTGICGAQEKLGDELKTLVDDTYQPLDRGYNELFRSMAQMRTEIESMQHILEKEATTSPSIDANKATSIDVKPHTSQIPAGPDSLVEKKDEWEIAYINTKINDVYNPLNNNVDWLSTRIDLLQQEGPTTNHIDRYLHHHIDRQQVRSHGR
ncbi:hypothetical protein F2Q68_00044146 [Brassica cretica]|uniref:Uncharacterized protein n=1 Tax=Brassica cretica TaxID=69181 RepID=A0A8S9LHP9_BRACR|nr:hypothetical protein F2Q68_00044146 [Brassica cretica]